VDSSTALCTPAIYTPRYGPRRGRPQPPASPPAPACPAAPLHPRTCRLLFLFPSRHMFFLSCPGGRETFAINRYPLPASRLRLCGTSRHMPRHQAGRHLPVASPLSLAALPPPTTSFPFPRQRSQDVACYQPVPACACVAPLPGMPAQYSTHSGTLRVLQHAAAAGPPPHWPPSLHHHYHRLMMLSGVSAFQECAWPSV